MQTSTLQISFPGLSIAGHEVAALRRMVNGALAWSDDLLHNHSADRKEIYRYPLVQFRTKNGIAVLFGIGQGVATLKKALMENQLPDRLIQEYRLHEQRHTFSIGSGFFTYHIKKYLPLSTENYTRWKAEKSLVGKLSLAENLLRSHVEEFCEAMSFGYPKETLQLHLKQLDKLPAETLEGSGNKMKFLCFDTIFETNINLPQGIGLGKGKSKGFGELSLIRAEKV